MASSGPTSERFGLSSAAAVRAGLGPLRYTASTTSTNDDLAREARGGDRSPAVLVADHQTAGRGRLGRRWSDEGASAGAEASLLVSFRLAASVGEARFRADAVTAAALAAARRFVGGSGARVRTKWPNDLLLERETESAKLAGILSEFVDGDPPVVVVGLGLNLAAAPANLDAAWMQQAADAVSRDELLASLLDALGGYLADTDRAHADVVAASATVGQMVRVERTDGTSVSGTAAGIDDAGCLIVEADSGRHRIEAGDVFHLRT